MKKSTELPASVDTTKKYKAHKDDTEDTNCTPGNFDPTYSVNTNENLRQYLGRSDVVYRYPGV